VGQFHSPSPTIVVGIDGSRAAVDAALWAVAEAVSRDVPLRLLYAIAPSDADARHAARELAAAETAIRYAFTALEAMEESVKIEVEIVQDAPVHALVDASRTASLVCLGAVGLKHAIRGQVGSTAAAVAALAHCPTAIIRRHGASVGEHGWILAEVDEWPTSTAVLERAIDEAVLRRAPLRVVTTWQSRFTDAHDVEAVAEGNRLVQAQLERRLAQWQRRHPDLDVQAVANHGGLLRYLAEHAGHVQLVVVGEERSGGTKELIGTPGLTVLHDTYCSVLSCARQRRL